MLPVLVFGLLVSTGGLQAQESVQDVLSQLQGEELSLINQKRAEYNEYAGKAKSRKVSLIRGKHLGKFSDQRNLNFDVEDMLALLPSGFIDTVNQKILNEYYRGYYEWYAGFLPPALYTGLYSSLNRSIFVYATQDVFVSGLPTFLWQLYISPKRATASSKTVEQLAGEIDALKPRLDSVLQDADAYIARGPTKKSFWGWLPWVDLKYDRGPWDAHRSSYESLMKSWRDKLTAMTSAVQARASKGLKKAVTWDTRLGAFYDWNRFDVQLTNNLPDELKGAVNQRFAKAYFKGALDRKYDRAADNGRGNGWGYDYRNPYGTGDDDVYSSGRRWSRYGGNGSYTGQRRTPLRGSGDDSQGSGNDGGFGSGDDNRGSGNDDPWDDLRRGSGDDGNRGSGDDNRRGSGSDGVGSGDDYRYGSGNDDSRGSGSDDRGSGSDFRTGSGDDGSSSRRGSGDD